MRDFRETMAEIERRAQDPAWQEEERKREAALQAKREREILRAVARALDEIGIPEKDRVLCASGSLIETQARQALREAEAAIVVLSGQAGCGKTTAAAAWLYDWIADPNQYPAEEYFALKFNGKAVWLTGARLARWKKYDDEAMAKLLTAHRLVLDDVGTEFLDEKGNYLSVLDEVINERYANRRKTVVTTNLTAEQFRARYGERIADRIREAGRFISLSAKSMRGKAA